MIIHRQGFSGPFPFIIATSNTYVISLTVLLQASLQQTETHTHRKKKKHKVKVREILIKY